MAGKIKSRIDQAQISYEAHNCLNYFMNPIASLKATFEEANLFQPCSPIKRNEILLSPGEFNTNLYFVESGSLRLFVMDELEEQTIRFAYQDSFFLALDTFITEKPTEFYAQALKKTSLKMTPKNDLLDFLANDFQAFKLWNKVLELLIFQQLERERDILTASPITRYQRVLARSPQLFQEIPHKYIASYLRMAPETLSRLKKS
jgi:CRP-like cAMP-binding protein